jgi:5-hydroxyisourate hydrolase
MISTHVLDTARGAPAARIPVELDIFISGQGWHEAGHGLTNEEGRIDGFGEPAAPGVYRLVFDVASYMPHCFFPSIAITFEIHNVKDEYYHVPLLLSPFGYSTYRGS